MSAQHSQGIQTLLDAEKEASKIVEKAKEYRTKRLRQTREEAKKESEEYRQSTEKKYRAYESEHSQGNTAAEENALKEAQGEIRELQASGEKGKSAAIEELLQAVRDAEPTPPVS
ncbi:hypothetical protein VUR80DRAFT_7076 [Thermomyces stellatus]